MRLFGMNVPAKLPVAALGAAVSFLAKAPLANAGFGGDSDPMASNCNATTASPDPVFSLNPCSAAVVFAYIGLAVGAVAVCVAGRCVFQCLRAKHKANNEKNANSSAEYVSLPDSQNQTVDTSKSINAV
jgi:hypothetical protein